MRIGLISDTHNVLRPQVIELLKTCDEIWHAGDFCEPEIWEALNALKPLRGVQGNNDEDPFFERLKSVFSGCSRLTRQESSLSILPWKYTYWPLFKKAVLRA